MLAYLYVQNRFLNYYIQEKSNNCNVYFHNIDGNKTNFDTLATEITKYKNTFSAIGIAETNVDKEHAILYPLYRELQ